jgi:hypothetical protein
MNYVLLGAGLAVAAVALLFVHLFRRLISPDRDPQLSLDWCTQFSIDKYRPMERLFSDEDYRFLAAQPGYSPQITKRLKAERRRIFRHYLRCLGRDFKRLHTAARFLLLHSPQDRPDLATALFRQRMVFRYAMLMVHCRLVLQPLGIGTVDVSGLVQALEGVGNQFRQLAAAAQQSLA